MTNKPVEESGICDGFVKVSCQEDVHLLQARDQGGGMSLEQPLPCSESSVLENEFWTAWSEHLGGPGSVLDTEDTVRRRLSRAQKELRDHGRNKEKDFSTNPARKVALLFGIRKRCI